MSSCSSSLFVLCVCFILLAVFCFTCLVSLTDVATLAWQLTAGLFLLVTKLMTSSCVVMPMSYFHGGFCSERVPDTLTLNFSASVCAPRG